jgi:hypothetical protein
MCAHPRLTWSTQDRAALPFCKLQVQHAAAVHSPCALRSCSGCGVCHPELFALLHQHADARYQNVTVFHMVCWCLYRAGFPSWAQPVLLHVHDAQWWQHSAS